MPPWASRHVGGSRQGHPRYTDARKGRPWVAHNTIHSATNVHNQKIDTTVFNNIHGSGAVLSPVQLSQNPAANRTSITIGQEVDGQLMGSRKQPRQRTQGDTLDSGHTPGHSGQERGIDQQSPYVSWKTNNAQFRTRVTRHQHSGDETALQHHPRAGRSQSVDGRQEVQCWIGHEPATNHCETVLK